MIVIGVTIALLIVLAVADAWTIIVPTVLVAALLVASYYSKSNNGLDGYTAAEAAFLVGDDLVHRHRVVLDGCGNIFPRPGLVLGVAMGDTCRLKTWVSCRIACGSPLRSPPCLLVLVLAISPVKDFRAEWKHYKRSFVKFAQGRPDTKKLLADYNPNIDQVWLPGMNVVDRCTTCHQGMTQPSLADSSVPQPFRAHPPIPHNVRDWGCTMCHRGQGPATEVAEAHRNHSCLGTADSSRPFFAGLLRKLSSRRHQRNAATHARPGTAFAVELPGCHKLFAHRSPMLWGRIFPVSAIKFRANGFTSG